MRITSSFMVLLLLGISAGSVTAGSIRCQGEILRDDQIHPPTRTKYGESVENPPLRTSGF